MRPRPEIHHELAEFVGAVNEAITIEQMARNFVASRVVPPEYREAALFKALKTDLRREINRRTAADGLPHLMSVDETDAATGEVRPTYKPPELFTVADYVQVWQKADGREKRAKHFKVKLERRYQASFPEEKPLRQRVFDFDAGDDERKAG